ncbi:pyridoxal phosphate-dependent decarboxylase family protein [Nocardioides bruguierae]|uniref:Aminotransferase class V-fold PLP-dependent enzyme n=1 Tax=Nocardioides bruguierae TaxID=2945102 RepID=A0A9X2IFG8_9ACTN|nr:aminotransferase class V-fold PLP-dependent enzyme [Nocardioides bruguierae]MCM0619705.1 aminotransferase class V-fold PLP-dependent enzyme [Nocardioides bruguierae]
MSLTPAHTPARTQGPHEPQHQAQHEHPPRRTQQQTQQHLRQLLHPAHRHAYADSARLAVDHLVAALARVRGPVTGLDPARAAALVAEVDLDAPLGCAQQALEELDRIWLDDTAWFHETGLAAHLNCPVLVPALVAEVLISGVNPSLDTFDQSVGGTFIEQRLVAWTAERIGFGPEADGVFTSGGTQSNLQALHLARDHALSQSGARLQDLHVLVSADGHYSVQRAARLLGLPASAVVPVAVDERRRMDTAALTSALEEVTRTGGRLMAVVATAGTTDHGAIDPLTEVADLAHRHGAWVHVDAAYGGGLLVSSHRALLAGIEHADSVTVDFHKTWFQPVSCSAVVVADRTHLRHVAARADYLNPADGGGLGRAAPDQVTKSLQTTRRFDALKLWLTLRVMGADGVGDLVDALVDLARQTHRRLLAVDDLQVRAAPELSTLLLRPVVPGLDAGEVDALVPHVRAALWERGEHVVAATVVDGRRWLKLTLLNPLAGVDDVLGVTRAVAATARALAGERAA